MGGYRWDGGQPHITEEGEVFRPLEVYEFDREPAFGPFTLIPDDDPAEPPGVVPPAASPGPPAPAPRTGISTLATSAPGLPATGTEGA